MATASNPDANPPRRWPWLIIGVLLFLLGPVLTMVQFNVLKKTGTPWQMSVLPTLGVLCMLLSVLQRGGVWRITGFLLFAIVGGLAWVMLLVGMAVPPYEGLARPGTPLPAFAANRADGRPLTNADLADGKRSVMLFFRGRW